jgi:hypothetical protein
MRPTGVSDLGTIAPTDVSVSPMIRPTGWPAASARRFACSMMAPSPALPAERRWRLAARIQIAALKPGELTKSIQVVNVSFALAEG